MNISEYKKVRTNFMKDAQAILAKEFKEIFDKYPNIDAIRWEQYTPNFNDGDVCEFNRREFDVRVVQKDKTSEVGTAELISAVEADDDDFYYGWNIDEKTPLGEVLSELEDKFDHNVVDVFKETFGDGVRVTATRKGFKTETFDHD